MIRLKIIKKLLKKDKDQNFLVTFINSNDIDRRKLTAQYLGISHRDLKTVREIKIKGSHKWALDTLEISHQQYTEMMKQDDYNKENKILPRINMKSFGHFTRSAYELFSSIRNNDEWRGVPPKNHLAKARDLIDEVISSESISTESISRAVVYLYYGMYNSLYGTRVIRRKAA